MRKIRLNRPTRFDQWSAGPFDVNLTARAITSIGVKKRSRSERLKRMSKSRFPIEYDYLSLLREVNQVRGFIDLSEGLEDNPKRRRRAIMNERNPILSVIIPVFNGERYIDALLKGIFENPLKDIEVLVGDDGSTDGTSQILQRWIEPRLKVIRSAEDRGAGAMRNMLLREARGKYVALQDADDFFDMDRFSKQVDFLENNPQVDVVGSGSVLSDDEGEWGIVMPPKEPSLADWLAQRAVVHASIMFKRKWADGFRYHESLAMGEDYYFLTQLYLGGAKFRNIEEPLYGYRVSEKDIRTRVRTRWKAFLYSQGVIAKLFPVPLRLAFYAVSGAKFMLAWVRSLPHRESSEKK